MPPFVRWPTLALRGAGDGGMGERGGDGIAKSFKNSCVNLSFVVLNIAATSWSLLLSSVISSSDVMPV